MSVNGRDLSRRRTAVYAALALSSLFSIALVAARFAYTEEPRHGWVLWNLFLAWIPFWLALAIYDRFRAGARPAALIPLGVLWLLFLPNAPYMVTDFKHLVPSAHVPIWFDIVVIAAPAWTGMLLGFLSLYLVQAVVRRLTSVATSWAFALSVLALASFGMYLGRVLRWNSWDVLVDPSLLMQVLGLATNAHAVAMTVLLTGFMTVTYFVVYAFVRLDGLEAED